MKALLWNTEPFACLVFLKLWFAEKQHTGSMIVDNTSQCDAQSTELVQERLVKLFHRFLLSVPIWHKIIVLFAK